MTDEQDDTPETVLEKAKRRIKASRNAFRQQRDREEQDLRFQVPEFQWDEDARAARKGGSVNGTQTAPRPTLSISKIDQPIQLVDNQARQAKLGVNIHPVSEKADKETAEVLQGIYRRIERDSHADQARLWAFNRAIKAGTGAYVVRTQWDEDAPADSFDQEIVIERILYQNMVGWDPSAQKPDFSDGEYSWLGAWMPLETFKREFPDAEYSNATESEFSDWAAQDSDWFSGSGKDRKVLVVEYWYKVHETEEIEVAGQKRKRDKVSVKWCKLTATEKLESQDWNGRYLPVIPVLGRELQPFGSERRWVGMVGPAKDGQKLYNFAASSLVERMALEPKTPWVMAEGQQEGHEPEWEQSNTRNLPYLLYRPVGLGDKQAPPPQRSQLDQTGMSLSMMALQEADQFIQATTSIYDPSLGRQNPRDKSGRAILALQSQSDAGTSHYLASLADISLTYEARVILDLIPAIYDRPGRISRILTGEDKDKVVMLNAPFVEDKEGFPQPAQPNQPNAKLFDLRQGGGYSVSVNIGKSFQTRLQQGSEQIGEILANAPDLFPVIGDIWIGFQDIPGSDEMKKRLAKWREMQMPGLGEGEEGQQPTVEQLQAQLQQMQQQGQMQAQQLQLAMEEIKTEQAKQQAAIMKAQLDAQTRLQVQQASDQTKLQIARLNAQVQGAKIAETEHADQVQLAETHAFEFNQNDKDRAHEAAEHNKEMAHEVAMAAGGAKTMKRTQDRSQESGQERTSEPKGPQ